MEKNTAGKWVVFAFQDEGGTNPGEPVTGDAANITANVRIDGGAANAVDDVNPTELEDGYYIFDITATEANGDLILICPQSSTANVNVIGVPGAVWTRPANFNDLSVTSSTGRVDVASVGGTTQTANDNGADINTLITEIGSAGAGLTAVPWNASWDAEVQSEVNDGLVALGLDHLVNVAVTGTDVTDNSIVAKLVSSSATADWDDYDNTTDSLEASQLGVIYGSTSGTPTTTSSNTDLTGYADDELIGRAIIFTGGTANGQASLITDYASTSGVVTYDTLTTAPAASDTFKIV